MRHQPTTSHEESRLHYYRTVASEGLWVYTLVATFYFIVVIVHLSLNLPPENRTLLLSQKFVYFLILLFISYKLKQGCVPLRHYSVVVSSVILLCLSSATITAAFGSDLTFTTSCLVLILSTAMMNISHRWATFHWLMIWIACAWSCFFRSSALFYDEIPKLLGIQLVAIVALDIRMRLYRKQFGLVTELAEALDASERIRANLDSEVEKRAGQLKSAYQELSLSVQERERLAMEREKLHEQLLHSQKMEALGRLAGGVAHDFNNLLTVIISSLELARMDKSVSPELEELLQASDVAANRAADLTGQLLAFSRKQVMKVKPFKIQRVVNDSMKLIERLLGEDINLIVTLNGSEAIVEGDPTQIQQVLLNLVVNARDAMPSGGMLTIGLYHLSQNDEVELRVTDSGHGIDENSKERIFEPFFTQKPLGKGTGLGLSTVHGIVNMHRGRITVESEPGKGATFVITLPTQQSLLTDSCSRKPVSLPSGVGRILLVEDDEQVRNLAVMVLRLSGYEVKAAESGEVALQILQENSNFNLLLTDVVMPGIDGGKLAKTVRQQLEDLPVLFMSGYTDDRLSSLDIDQDNCGFLPKPFTPGQLNKAVKELLVPPPRSLAVC